MNTAFTEAKKNTLNIFKLLHRRMRAVNPGKAYFARAVSYMRKMFMKSIPGASSFTKMAPAPNSLCGGAFVTFGGSISISTFAVTMTICSKLKPSSNFGLQQSILSFHFILLCRLCNLGKGYSSVLGFEKCRAGLGWILT
jgi:hypothetical protein